MNTLRVLVQIDSFLDKVKGLLKMSFPLKIVFECAEKYLSGVLPNSGQLLVVANFLDRLVKGLKKKNKRGVI